MVVLERRAVAWKKRTKEGGEQGNDCDYFLLTTRSPCYSAYLLPVICQGLLLLVKLLLGLLGCGTLAADDVELLLFFFFFFFPGGRGRGRVFL